MTDIEYVVKCCREHAKRIEDDVEYYNASRERQWQEICKLRARNDALIALCTARKPRSRTGAKRDSELHKLLKEYPV